MALTQVSSGGIADGAVTTNDLENSGVTAGTYGSSSAIPAITVDAKGRITSASTNSVTQVGGANGVTFNDNVNVRFGTGNDLSIFHDGGNSILDHAGTGNLRIVCNTDDQDITLESDNSSGSTTTYVRCDGSSGAVILNHYGTEKFTTTTNGIEVTGSVTCDGLTCDGDATISSGSGKLIIKDNNSTDSAISSQVVGQDSSGTVKWQVGYASSSNNALYVWNVHNNDVLFGTNGAARCYVNNNGHFVPYGNNTYDLGTSSLRWRNVYTNDLNLSNEGGTNDVDGTWGSWTIQEGEDDLFLLNRRNGKKYKFNLSEVS